MKIWEKFIFAIMILIFYTKMILFAPGVPIDTDSLDIGIKNDTVPTSAGLNNIQSIKIDDDNQITEYIEKLNQYFGSPEYRNSYSFKNKRKHSNYLYRNSLEKSIKKIKINPRDDLSDQNRILVDSFNKSFAVSSSAIDYAMLNIIDIDKKFESSDQYVYIPTITATNAIQNLITTDLNFRILKDKILIMTVLVYMNGYSHYVSLILDTIHKVAQYYDCNYPEMDGNSDHGVAVLKRFLIALEIRNQLGLNPDDNIDTENWILISPQVLVLREPNTENGCGLYSIKFMDGTINHGFMFPGTMNDYRENLQKSVLNHIQSKMDWTPSP